MRRIRQRTEARPGRSDEPMPVQPARLRNVVGPTDDEPRDSGRTPERRRHRAGRYSLLVIDNVTGKATRVDVKPLTVEGILRTNRRDRPMLVGYLLMALLDAAHKLWPDFDEERRALATHPLSERIAEVPEVPFVPVWKRPRGQTLVEYALVLALIAVVAIVVLVALGGVVADVFSNLGKSI